jgi:hypothetical protein
MTTLENRPETALLVIDVQNGVVAGAHERDSVVANIDSLVAKARREAIPVVWVQHSDEQLARGSDEWCIVPELAPADAEPLVEKNYGDSFEDTKLRACWLSCESGGFLSPARRPMRVSARRFTAHSSAATTQSWSVTPTRRRT